MIEIPTLMLANSGSHNMTFKSYQNVPFAEVPLPDRVKYKELAICQGGCNKLSPIHNTTYNLCSRCSDKWRYYGYSCDVPNCDSVADGTTSFTKTNNKMVCNSCRISWNRMDNCIWERFVESRHLVLLRPKTFVKALEDGLVIPAKNTVMAFQRAECQHCKKESRISNATYKLCSTCSTKLQYLGETCGVCKISDANGFDTSESIFVCLSCQSTKNKYNITSYQIYKTQIRTILNCQICNTTISHDRLEGQTHPSANIDHDHDTNEIRGVLCFHCNVVEGLINKMPIGATTYAKNLVTYLENPPLTNPWTQSL